MPRSIQKTFEISELPLIDPEAIPPIPESMEARLFQVEGNELEPCVILYHPQCELHVKIRLTDLHNMQHYVDELNSAVLKQAMGETPEEEGYRL